VTRLLIASTGGHLAELVELAPRLRPRDEDELWITFESAQSSSLLRQRRVEYVRPTPPRDWRSVLMNVSEARRILNREQPNSVVSDGAGIALSFLPIAQARGVSTHYIESAARTAGVSLTGHVLERLPRIHLYVQHETAASRRWRYEGSVFDGFEYAGTCGPQPLRKIVITVGSLGFRCDRLIDRLKAVIPTHVDVLAQVGPVARDASWPGADVRETISPEELAAAMAEADVVVSHAGIGSILMALDSGHAPVLIPRLGRYAEHVDDHQTQIARRLADAGLAIAVDASAVEVADLLAASAKTIRRVAAARDLVLASTRRS
jgi:UDP-N-acetylglucosamine--N-acetylmuramyl-(pentapeptide) pyrophosphoryl-undecaprenol N-acetylglucosamine transferase